MPTFRNAFEGDKYRVRSQELTKAEYVSWVGNPYLTDRTRQYIRDVYSGDASFGNGKSNFALRVPITRKRTPGKFYRKMSVAEYGKVAADGVLGAALKYNNTQNYRVWMSSSLAMVKQFTNVNTVGAADVILEMTFDADLIQVLTCRPHQNTGVQSDPSVIAVHREDFAHYGVFNDAELIEVRDKWLDLNLGICSDRQKAVEDRLTGSRLVP